MSLAPGRTLRSIVEERAEVGSVHGDIEAMLLLRDLLSIIAHIHERGLVHRDIKDANMLTAGPGMTSLIDFGFCKEAGTSAIRSTDSFWRVGAARFSPPAKLENPGMAVPSHDVFAAGVMAYRMLTATFPWSTSHQQDAAALRAVQQNQTLVPVRDHNSRVLRSVSTLVSRMLALNDDWRPTAAQALEETEKIISLAKSSTARRSPVVRYPHVIRDPVYGDVRFTDDEYRALDTPEMQRLRVIKQLGLTDMVYPSAVHSRLAHAIGCVERVERILSTVERHEGIHVDEEIRLVARLYALVHDVSHVAFGHTLEDELGFFSRHDDNRARIDRLVGRETSELGQHLRASDAGRATIGLLTGELSDQWRVVLELVSGLTGADVLDYVDRDALFCGLDHRIDSALFRQFRLQPLPGTTGHRLVSLIAGKYGVRMDRNFAVESVLRERYAMFLKVYTHSAKVAASALLGKALAAAYYSKAKNKPVREEQIEHLGDETLLDLLSAKSSASWAVSMLRRRRFPRGVYRAVLLDEGKRLESSYDERLGRLRELGALDPRRRIELEASIARSARVNPQNVIVYCPLKAPGYQRVEHWVTMSRNTPPTRQTLSEFSQRHLGLWDLWVFVIDVPELATRNAVADAAQEVFGDQNVIDVDRRQGRLF
jgi:HD superfamily phosphohydrolase